MLIRAPLLRAKYLRKRKRLNAEEEDDESNANNTPSRIDIPTAVATVVSDDASESNDNNNHEENKDSANEETKENDDGPINKQFTDGTKVLQSGIENTIDAVTGDRKRRAYYWKLFAVWFPFFKAVGSLFTLMLIIGVTPSSPRNSPAEWRWIIMAVFVSTVNVFFPTFNSFVLQLRHYPDEFPTTRALIKICTFLGATYNAIIEIETLVPFIMMYFAIHGMSRYYMCSLLLLDIIFLNERLKNVIRAVTYTATDLAVTFVLMAFVVFIFTAFGMYQFGQMVWFETDEAQAVQLDDENGDFAKGVIYNRDDDAAAYSLCPNLAVCFLEFFDSGLRSGDIVDATFDDLTYQDNVMAYFGRIVFGLSFFLIIGVILFDIVTGIIIDKFGELREQTAVRLDKIKNSTFIADIDRSTCDENRLDFDEINSHDQDKWNYVKLMAHLEFKDEDEYTGAESMIADAISKWDIGWMPQKNCWQMQTKSIAADLEDADDIILQAKHDIIQETTKMIGEIPEGNSLHSLLAEMKLQLTKLENNQNELRDAMNEKK